MMITGVWSVAVSLALSANPGAYPAGAQPGYGAAPSAYGAVETMPATYSGGYGSLPVNPASCNNCSSGYGGDYASYGGGMGGGYPGALPSGGAYPGDEPMFPYDSQMPWMHGHIQEIPAYHGFVYFRPYNYKHVLSQSQLAGGWGMSPTMPYSHQFWHRFQQPAAMNQQMSSHRGAAGTQTAAVPLPTIRSAAPAVRPQEALPASYVTPAPTGRPVIQPRIAPNAGELQQRFTRTSGGAIELSPMTRSTLPR